MGTEDEEIIREAISILKASGSLTHASETAKTMIKEAWRDLESDLPDDSELARKAKR